MAPGAAGIFWDARLWGCASSSSGGSLLVCRVPQLPSPNSKQMLDSCCSKTEIKAKARGAAAGRGEGQDEAGPSTGQGIAALGSAAAPGAPASPKSGSKCPKCHLSRGAPNIHVTFPEPSRLPASCYGRINLFAHLAGI